MALIVAALISLAISLALSIVSYLITPQPKVAKPVAAKDLESPTAEAGREMPVPFGTLTIKSPNCLWYGEKSKLTYKVAV
ncbi:hypothetical protein U1872_06390 [Sphingomonas sp. RB3P16]|uniref:hypothetical protein n=1 Tax=Parasphingomonas frigoris TaxID=3096163 RepID=UPI002FC743BE